MISAKVEGLAELQRRMRELGPKLSKSILRSATNAGAQIIKKEVQRLVPVDTGRLRNKAIFVQRSRRESSEGRETFRVGVRLGDKDAQKDRDAYYWWWLEFGTGPRKHKKTGKDIGSVAARPFLRPAFESKKMEALEAMKKRIFQKLEQLTAGNK